MKFEGWAEGAEDEPEVKTVWKPYWHEFLIQHLVCNRCGTNKYEYFGRKSKNPNETRVIAKISTRYVYPEGYAFHGKESVHERPELQDFYEESVRRLWYSP
jgi:hypothetical protein